MAFVFLKATLKTSSNEELPLNSEGEKIQPRILYLLSHIISEVGKYPEENFGHSMS